MEYKINNSFCVQLLLLLSRDFDQTFTEALSSSALELIFVVLVILIYFDLIINCPCFICVYVIKIIVLKIPLLWVAFGPLRVKVMVFVTKNRKSVSGQ
jgi:hypothetical protein